MRAVEECYRGKQVRVFQLNRDAVIARLQEGARRLLDEEPEVLEVRLFGSLARGDATPGSDADLLVVLRDDARPFLERIPSLSRALGVAGIGCDILAYTESELRRLLSDGNAFVHTASAEGLVLARRSPGLSRDSRA